MPNYYRCEFRDDIQTCLNNCPYKDKGDCIDGMPIPKKVNPKEQAKKIINQKYKRPLDQELRRQQMHRIWLEKNRDKYYAQVKEYRAEHPEMIKYISRKSWRLKQLRLGQVKKYGIAEIQGQKVAIYKAKKINTYWYVLKDEYFETDENELRWCWIQKGVAI